MRGPSRVIEFQSWTPRWPHPQWTDRRTRPRVGLALGQVGGKTSPSPGRSSCPSSPSFQIGVDPHPSPPARLLFLVTNTWRCGKEEKTAKAVYRHWNSNVKLMFLSYDGGPVTALNPRLSPYQQYCVFSGQVSLSPSVKWEVSFTMLVLRGGLHRIAQCLEYRISTP